MQPLALSEEKGRNNRMEKAMIFHRAINEYAYGYDDQTIHLVLQTKHKDAEKVELIYGDPYDFEQKTWNYVTVPVERTGETTTVDYYKAKVKPPNNRMRYGFKLTGYNGEEVFYLERGTFAAPSKEIGDYFCFPYFHPNDEYQAPDWVKDTVWYQIFPERFKNGEPSISPRDAVAWEEGVVTPKSYYGGDLQGVIDGLDYLEDLGINGIYFTPIFKSPSNHKYDTIDYYEIDPHFGDKKTFKRLVEACHSRGIRVMLDAVFNHSGYEFEPFQDVLKNEQASKYKDWFHMHDFPVQTEPKPNYETFGFVSRMPKLNTQNKEVQNYLLDVSKYWVEVFDIDGWRLDVANEVDHRFWRKFRDAVKGVKEDVYIVGEVWHDSMSWLRGDEFDAVMNYPLVDSLIRYIEEQSIDKQTFKERIVHLLHMYPQHVTEHLFNILASHDTARLITQTGDSIDKAKLLYLFQFSYPGSPCIYYGDEIGMVGGEEPESRGCMIWDKERQDLELRTFIQTLIHLRKTETGFSNEATFTFVETSDESLTYQKETTNEQLIFIINPTAEPIRVSDYKGDLLLYSTEDQILNGYGYCVIKQEK
ncbi:Glycosidase [Halolactibacillus halophilus]|uniref:Glycosidase n=2 Tax=Halolactibacillus halophilus TaxID=306540 RepID=A0A1I5LVD9_9BACI|nr:Glycosidase [Halolactibacillus halophilus]